MNHPHWHFETQVGPDDKGDENDDSEDPESLSGRAQDMKNEFEREEAREKSVRINR
jgi:hypothetical protein